jgi:hypothetical protein
MGHRSDVRAVALSDDDATLLSTGSGGTKLWSSQHGTILNNVDTGYGLSALFAPGGRYAVVGCKSGHCDIVDVGMATTIDSVEAHSAQVRQMQQPVTRVNSIIVYSLKLLLECSLVADLLSWLLSDSCKSSSPLPPVLKSTHRRTRCAGLEPACTPR